MNLWGQDSTKQELNTFSIDAQLRNRFEYRNGSFRPLSKSEDVAIPILNRIRLGLNYEYTDIVKTKITLQNVNLWGQANQIQGLDKSGNTFSIFEAYADVKIYKNFRTIVGRQIITYDDERIFGAADWTNSARAHDALTLYLKGKKYEIRSNLALNQNYKTFYNNNVNNPTGNLYDNTDAQGYKNLQNLWAKYQFTDHSDLSFLFSNVGFQDADSINAKNKVNYLQTTGLNYHLNLNHFHGSISGYYQFGKTKYGSTANAYLLAIHADYKIKEKFRIGIGSDLESGNTIGQTNTQDRHFQMLFATGHKFNGSMDYYNAGSPFLNIGLNDNYLEFEYKINPKLKLNLAGHWFLSPTEINVANINYDRNLGQEIDFKFDYKINSFIDLSLGYSTYFTTRTTGFIKSVNNLKLGQHWAWVSLNITPTLFKTKF